MLLGSSTCDNATLIVQGVLKNYFNKIEFTFRLGRYNYRPRNSRTQYMEKLQNGICIHHNVMKQVYLHYYLFIFPEIML